MGARANRCNKPSLDWGSAVKPLLLVVLMLVMAACAPPEREGAQLSRLTIRVHPGHATVRVGEAGEMITAVVTQRGPLATFELPPGIYRYEVSAEGYAPFVGVFEIPRNRNLEVWLSP